MLTKVLIGLAAILVVLLIVIATRPPTFRYTRSLAIAAPPSWLFDQINDLKKFQAWNPWASVDPSIVLTYAGPSEGSGSSYTWAGNNQVGEGTMTITETKPGELVRARMEFRKPMANTCQVDFTFVPQPDGTTLASWSMYGDNTFMGKAIGLVIDCDKMCGDQFSKGLATLKTLAESTPATLPTPAA
jgi:hypothetical protein